MEKIINALNILGRAGNVIDCAGLAADQFSEGEPISVVNSFVSDLVKEAIAILNEIHGESVEAGK